MAVFPGCDRPRSDTPALTLLFTGTLLGKAEPCGCFTGDFGGIVRIASYVNRVREEVPNTVYVDLGDLFFESNDLDPFETRQFPLKARMMMETLESMGCDAWLPGDFDFAHGLPLLRELEAESGFPFLLANVVDAQSGESLFRRSAVVEVGEWKIGMFGLVGRQLNEPATASDEETIQVGRRLAQRGLRLLDPIETAQEVVGELQEECDLIVALGHVGLEGSRELADEVPGIDVVLGAHYLSQDMHSDRSEKTGAHICMIKVKGSRVGRVDFYGDPTNPRRADDSHRANLLHGIREQVRELDWIEEQLAVKRDAVQLKQRMTLRNQLAAGREMLETVEPKPGPDVLEHYLVLIDRFVGADADADRLMRDYHQATRAFWTEEGPGKRLPRAPLEDKANFIGYRACTTCHPHQYEFWKGTGHGRAYATLEATYQELDVECFKCHTTGWRAAGSFKQPLGAQKFGFTDVQCEACHGPGDFHSFGGENTVLPGGMMRTVSPQVCAGCHNAEHDPKFNYGHKLPLVACPETPPGDPTLRAARESAVPALEGRVRRGRDQYRAVLGRLLLNLGRADEAVEVLEFFDRDTAISDAGRLLLARAYFDTEQFDRALALSKEIMREDPEMSEAYIMAAKILLEQDRTEEAFELLQSGISLHPTRHTLLKIFGHIVYEAGGAEALEAALLQHLENNPDAIGAVERVRSTLIEGVEDDGRGD